MTTYEVFVAPTAPYHYSAGSNNHILNSLVMRLFVSVFGLSHLAARSGALLGALVYICAAVALCASITKSELLRCLAFVCLACNPFMMDYLVVARGYALAYGFLLAMLAVMATHYEEGRPSAVRACAACSAFAALSVASNFAFTFACASVLILFAVSVWPGAGTGRLLTA